MLETLYKIKTPEDVPPEKTEYYELVLDQKTAPFFKSDWQLRADSFLS
jgi:hypothetical protein